MKLLSLISLIFLVNSSSAQSQCAGGIPAKEVKSILDVHNSLRQTIAAGKFVAKDKLMPPAKTSIPDLTWDCGIEQSAQKHASQCQFEHSTGLNNLGENLYMMWSSVKVTIDGQGKAASDSWANEFQEYGWSDIKFTMDVFNSGVGHATQMAWQKTTQIGCGMALCKGEKSVLVTCQYRDAGNYINQYVYIPK
uniref:SCP domain-containing protein n=1 Tax=Pristionchus pacificus TaxID=54126 RepID=A0A8R1UJP6_PRIPA